MSSVTDAGINAVLLSGVVTSALIRLFDGMISELRMVREQTRILSRFGRKGTNPSC